MRGQGARQTGFSAIAVVIAVLVVGVIAVSGVLVYQHHRNSTKPTANANSSQTTSQQTSTTSTQPAPTTYLTIKEWGVKLPLSDSIKDAYYVVSTGSADSSGQPNTLWLGLASLDSNGCAASLGNTAGADRPLGALGRALPTDHEPVQGTLYTQLYPGTIIGGYYYFYIDNTNGKACTSAATLQSINAAFTAAAKSIISASATTN